MVSMNPARPRNWLGSLTDIQEWNGTAWSSIANAALTLTGFAEISIAYPEISGVKVLVYTNYKAAIRKWTGTGDDANLGGSPPLAKYLLNYYGYVILAYINDTGTEYRSRVQWSDAENIEDYSTGDASYQDLIEDDLLITGLSMFGEYACVHKERSIHLGYLTGTDAIFQFDRKAVGAGTVSNAAIVNLPTGEQIFLSREGLRLFNGITSPLIQSTINLDLQEFMSVSYMKSAWGIHVGELSEAWFGIAIGDQTLPETIYKYNYITGQVYRDEMVGISTAGLYTPQADDTWNADAETWDSDTSNWDSATSLALHRRVVWGYNSGLSVERTDSANDNGTAIDAEWESKDFTAYDFEIDDPECRWMEWQGVEVIAKGTAVSVYYSTDEGVNWTLVKTITLDSTYRTSAPPSS